MVGPKRTVLAYASQLRKEDFAPSHVWPHVQYAPQLTFVVSPLTTYLQDLHPYRLAHRRYASDIRAFTYAISQPQVQKSLEVVRIPSEVMAFDEFGASELPRLKTLTLRGELDTPPAPLISFLGGLPALEELQLNTARRANSRLTFCPPNWSGKSPWPRLRSLSVSYPEPDDPLYSHLPPSLRCLALRCWPRHYVHLIAHDCLTFYKLGWRSPLLTATEMCRVLSRCRSSLIEELDVEFLQDEADLDVFRLVASAFPNLQTLTIHRYRQYGCYDVPLQEIGEALSPLARLRFAYFHLDFKDMPHPFALYGQVAEAELQRFYRTVETSADILARTLGASVEVLCILRRVKCANNWLPFSVERMPEAVRARYRGSETTTR
ncbi:hypothetical protein BD413DRAFT_606835 [Trametes elegans]|nr:hypothetical protein BD413DRAFT_606835 [Trametes elegans]